MSSQSEFEIIFSFIGTDTVVKGEIIRFQAPQTFEALNDKMRDQGFYTVRSRGNLGRPKAYWMLLVELNRGGEKKEYKDFQIGDIVYCPRQDALYLIYGTPVMNYPVYHFGRITEGMELLSGMRNGTMVKIEFKEK